ncbi:hypothetical protein D917_03011 [Trichinella nativa]|uniref:DUF4440 domain-containing protein n=1 Tax=Trichinella nativa TaxID=6335 RepID=A0A1Y3EB59_9BILA|nr:hypothetical protein D917_03011 [Trichinella nativa]
MQFQGEQGIDNDLPTNCVQEMDTQQLSAVVKENRTDLQTGLVVNILFICWPVGELLFYDIETELRARNAQMAKAVREGNATAVANIYAEDCHFMPHSMQPTVGRKAVEAYMKQDFNEGVKMATVQSDEVHAMGDFAFQRGTYKLDGNRGPETGAYVYIWKKIGAEWYIYIDCFNVIQQASG